VIGREAARVVAMEAVLEPQWGGEFRDVAVLVC